MTASNEELLVAKESVADMIRTWQSECAAFPAIYNQGNVLLDRLDTLRLAAQSGGAVASGLYGDYTPVTVRSSTARAAASSQAGVAPSDAVREALDNSQSLLVAVYGIGPHLSNWKTEDVDKQLEDQIAENRAALTASDGNAAPEAGVETATPASPEPYCRPEVIAFARLMETELRANDHKPGWKDDDPDVLARRVQGEATELLDAAVSASIHSPVPVEDRKRVAEEAADVANMAMMVADVCGCLDTAPAQQAVDVEAKDAEIARLRQELADTNDDLLRRHKDAVDRFERIIEFEHQITLINGGRDAG